MEKAIKLLSLVDEYSFIPVFIVISRPADNMRVIESVPFLSREEAQAQCDYLNHIRKTYIYHVFETSAHV